MNKTTTKPNVEGEAPTIFQTTDYDQFKTVTGNRKVSLSHAADIARSIARNNLLPFQPIVVNSNLEVIDGQHRLYVASQMQLPIYFVIKDDASINEVQLLNKTALKWTIRDFVSSYAIKGNDNYLWLENLYKNSGFSISAIVRLLRNSNEIIAIREGKFIIRESERAQAEEMVDALGEMRQHYSPKQGGNHWISTGQIYAFRRLWSEGKGMQLIKSLRKSGKIFDPRPTADDAYRQLLSLI